MRCERLHAEDVLEPRILAADEVGQAAHARWMPGAAVICGTTHKTAKRIVAAHEAGGKVGGRRDRGHYYDAVAELVTERVRVSRGRISAKRLLPVARAAGYAGSARNFRRLVAEAKAQWQRGHHRGRRPAAWMPGDTLAVDWGSQGSLHVFCAVLAWSRVWFVGVRREREGRDYAAAVLRPQAEHGTAAASPDRADVWPGGGGGRESNPPTTRSAVHRF